MLAYKSHAVVILAFCLFIESNGLGIHLFGKKDGSVKEEALLEEGKDDNTPRPPLLSIPRPEDHPLHHNNDPNHPFNNLPSLGSLGGTRSTIVATKTVYVEVTSTITQHPICIEVHGVKPPCLPHYTHGHGYESGFGVHSEHGVNGIPSNNFGFQAGVSGFFREGGQEIDRIQPTATIEILEPTRILGGVSETLPSPSEYQDEEENVEEESRSARYLKIHGATPSAPLKAEPEIDEAPEVSDEVNGRLLENLINRQPEYHYATKTLWVTKVQKYVDHKVTATLVIKNCIPNEFHYPFCHSESHAPEYPINHYYKPVHHEPTHHEPIHKPVHHEPVHHEPIHHESHHHEPIHHETHHHEPIHKPVHHEPVHKPVHHEPVHHEPAHIPVHETHYQSINHHNAHEYPQPIHVETQYIPGHEVTFNGAGSASLSGGISSNFKENDHQATNEQPPKRN